MPVAGVIMLDSRVCVCTTREHTCAQAALPDVPSQGPRPWDVRLTQPPRKRVMGIFSFQEHTLLPRVGGHQCFRSSGASVLTRSGPLETGREGGGSHSGGAGLLGDVTAPGCRGGLWVGSPPWGPGQKPLVLSTPPVSAFFPLWPLSLLWTPRGTLQAPRVWGSRGSGSPTVGLPGREGLSLCRRSSHLCPVPSSGLEQDRAPNQRSGRCHGRPAQGAVS